MSSPSATEVVGYSVTHLARLFYTFYQHPRWPIVAYFATIVAMTIGIAISRLRSGAKEKKWPTALVWLTIAWIVGAPAFLHALFTAYLWFELAGCMMTMSMP